MKPTYHAPVFGEANTCPVQTIVLGADCKPDTVIDGIVSPGCAIATGR